MRTGEAFALTWDDIDFENKTIKVNKTVYCKDNCKNGRWFLGTTKTEGSSRIVYMCDTLYKLLLKYKNIQNNKNEYKKYYLKAIKNKYGRIVEYQIIKEYNKRNKIKFVFVKDDGTYVGKDIIKYPYKIIHNELKIKGRFYDLRSNFATKALRNGIEIKDVSKVLGHARIETTENYYIGCSEDSLKSVSKSLENNLNIKIDMYF